MKTSIIYLGIALITFTNVVSALDKQQSFVKEDGLAQTVQLTRFDVNNQLAEKRENNDGEVSADFTPEIIAVAPYQKTMEEIIAENNQITESTSPEQAEENIAEENSIDVTIEGIPATAEKVFEDRIIQDSQIIESTVLTAVQPIASAKSKRSKN